MPFSILIVDDEILTLNNLKKFLEKEGYEIYLAENGEKALEITSRIKPDLILLDLMLPGISGVEVLRQVKEKEPNTVIIMMTAYEIIEKAVEAMKLGAYDYLLKPFPLSELKNSIHRALETLSLKIRIQEHLNTEKGRYYFGRIIANSPKMKEILNIAQKIALMERTTVLIQGESGTGKELLAKAIHYHSPRSEGPLIEINCAAIPENLLESELFGYEPGAFTDAKKRKIGLLEKGNEGTVFFDEIGDMSLNLQAKVLRVLEDGKFMRLGGNKPVKIDIRVIAATNKNLQTAVKEGRFREDLYYRLNVVPIHIPPLRERKEDIIPLALFFMSEYNRELKRSYTGITPEAAEALEKYSWPGNVRELRNIIERIMSLNDDHEIRYHHLPVEIQKHQGSVADKMIQQALQSKELPTLKELEEKYIQNVLSNIQGGINQKLPKFSEFILPVYFAN
jgi:two-component system response regulator AtoC